MSHPAFSGGTSREDPELTERQRRIFLALVEMHRRTARPVSSETLLRETGVGGSAAGIRGALAELEGMGLLRRDHPAAARVPSAAVPVATGDVASAAQGKSRSGSVTDPAGISQAWFADGERLDGGRDLDTQQAQRLDRARALISPSDTGLLSDDYDERRGGARRWLIAGGVGADSWRCGRRQERNVHDVRPCSAMVAEGSSGEAS